MNSMKHVEQLSDIPKGPHYVVMEMKRTSVHHEGDERSRTNPGHGYPAWTENVTSTTMYVTLDEEVWKNFVKAQHLLGKVFMAYHVDRIAKIETSVSVV